MFQRAIEFATIVSSFIIQHILYRNVLPADFKPRRILVVKLDHLGDMLLATPVFSNLRSAYPHAQIHALVGRPGVLVLQNHPDVNKTIRYDARFFSRSNQPVLMRYAFQLFRNLRRKKYDLLIDLRGDWLTVLFALLKGTFYRLDLASLQTENKLGIFAFTGSHQLDRNLDILRTARIPTPHRAPIFRLSLADRQWTDEFLNSANIVNDLPLVAIHPGSPIKLKRWRPERYAAVADWLVARKNAQILFVGVKSEVSAIAGVQKHMDGESTSVAGSTNLSQLAGILERCNLFIGNDSGPMHLAAAVGTQTIGLYGPGNPERFGPVGSHCCTIRRMPDCPPCMGTSCKFGGDGCMKEIEVGEVIRMAEQRLIPHTDCNDRT
ncbi:MAG: glycosyltransferase family 9 protein [Candidatus Poribacteria bacterium]|nr:glycosyltransferase family 9 protein [Candidatus Poribacteria bacterium]